MTRRELLHRLVDESSDAEVEAALRRLTRERDEVERWAVADGVDAISDGWALANVSEAIREERW